jgi:DNA modification methylase
MANLTHIKDLTPDPVNRRSHNPRNVGMLVDALQKVGASRSIVVDEDGVILAGNGVVEAASEAGLTKLQIVEADGETIVAVRRRGLTPAQKRELAIYDNRTAELAEWNVEQLAADLRNGEDLTAFFFEDELKTLLAGAEGVKGGLTDPDAVPQERPTGIVAGDLFELGAHRLLCGDSTAGADVARLLGSVVPHLCVTDPPYGVNYDPGWRNVEAAKGNLAYAARRIGPVTNDNRADWREAWALFPGDVLYSWHPPGATSLVHAAAIQDSGFTIRMQIIWAKSNFPIGRSDYHVRHEPCWYAVRTGKPSKRTDDRTQTTLWEINLDKNVEGGHSTQKPVECMARAIRNHETEVVYDPFLGSGTTIVAAEQLSRQCFALEIEPLYCQVSIDRWEAFTGQKAQKVGEAVRA